jgi:hypothetical protein
MVEFMAIEDPSSEDYLQPLTEVLSGNSKMS